MENEEILEQVTEESTEPDTTNEVILERLESIDEHLEHLDSTEEVTEEVLEESSSEDASTEESTELVYLDPTIDHSLYFTTQVENADLNDIYTIQLSIRNILLIFGLFALAFICYRMIRGTVDRLLNR